MSIHAEYKTIDEGSFRFDEVKKHLDRYKAPAVISIGEDATRVVGRVDYDSETDRCVGFVLPLNEHSLPIVDSFIAVSFPVMEKMFYNHTIAKYAYIYMAQPLCITVLPVCLACLGIDNKFDAENVMARWKYIAEEFTKRNVAVISFGGDGDSRLMKCMKVSTSIVRTLSRSLSLNVPSNSFSPAIIPKDWRDWFHAETKTISYVQDTVHIAVKLKSRFLKPRIVLPMGDYTVTGDHLYALKAGFPKDLHGLRLKDINHKDKQNFQAVINITSAGHLLSKIPKANGTKCYVELIKFVMDSYLDNDLDPLSRVEKMWYAVFFVRYWRKWILLNHRYTLRDNFITPNAYIMCIELNAHSLITFLLTVRDHIKNDSCFLPWLLGSQCCEMTFRIARSMSSTFSTVINFGMLGLLRRLHRLHIQLTLQAECSEDIIFPRVIKHQQKVEKSIVKAVFFQRSLMIKHLMQFVKHKAEQN